MQYFVDIAAFILERVFQGSYWMALIVISTVTVAGITILLSAGDEK